MSGASLDSAPAESLDSSDSIFHRWGVVDPNEDPFGAGARWAAGYVFDTLFGDLLGPQFLEVQNVQKWNPASSVWVPLA